MPKQRNLIGQRFGDLVAIGKHPVRKKQMIQYTFLCDCGNEIVLPGIYMHNTNRKNCGCKASMFFTVSDNIKAQILESNKLLTGSMTKRGKLLAKQYDLSPKALSEIIRHTVVKIKRMLTEEDKQQIRVLYDLDNGINDSQKFKSIESKTGFSYATVRTVVKSSKEEIFYNPKIEVF